MNPPKFQSHSSPLRHAFTRVAATAAILGCFAAPLQAIDANITKQIWRLKHGVTAGQVVDNVWLALDSDGDGVKNGDELAAGSNPFNPGTTIRVTGVALTGGNDELTFPTEAGKRYRAECAPSLTGTYVPVGTHVTGTGSSVVISLPHTSDCFYRIRVDELDTDGDGVSDWAEIATGLNPTQAQSNAGVDDDDFVNGELALPSEVSIKAMVPFASEDGPTLGSFMVSRKQRLLPITVSLSSAGTATAGVHYSALPGSVVIPAGQSSVEFSVTPMLAPAVEGSKSVTAQLVPPGGAEPPYVLGANDEATVIINDSAAPTGTGLRAQYYDTANATYASSQNFDPAQLKIDRVDPVVNNDWAYGTPNDVAVVPGNPVDNYSTVFEGYLHPTTAGDYQFQLDADDKARVLLDLNNNGTFDLPGEQIIEHGWDSAATVGTFKVSAAQTLAVPAGAAQRYKIRVEHVETTGDARCRLQWRLGTAGFANIPSTNVFSHTRAISSYSVTSNVATINTSGAHGLVGSPQVTLNFSSGGLFTPPANYSGQYTVSSIPSSTSFTVIMAAPNMGTGGAGFMADSTTTTTGWLNQVYTNTAFTTPAGYVNVLGGGATNANNGIWGSGTPSPTPGGTFIDKDTFSIRWTGQVQPQFSETYSFIVQADESCALYINGQLQEMKTVPSTFSQIGASPNYSYNSISGNVVVTYTSGVVKPNSYTVGEPVRVDFTSGNLTHGNGSTYTYDGATGYLTVDYSNLTNIIPGGFTPGETIELDPTAGTLTTLATLPYVVFDEPTTSTFRVYIEPGLFDSQTTGATINILDTRNATITAVTSDTFTISVGTGKYNTGTGNVNVEIANKALKDWFSMGNERYVRIPMVAGVRYDIQLDYYENTSYSRCLLSWFSPSQPKQIIPSERLYPSNGTIAPSAHITSTDASALVNGAFSIPIAGSNGGSVTLSGNPAWLTYSGGVLSGTPPTGAAGDYQIIVTITSAAGVATSVVNLHVDENAGNVVREFWNGSYATLAAVPFGTAPTGSGNISPLEAVDAGEDFGARVRGYISAPVTGNYYFWIAASSSAELWISNDDEPVNAFKRAWVNAGSATAQTWNAETNQKSPWLALEQGKKYYFEVLQRAAAGADNLAIGWARPGEALTAPSQVVPGFALSPYTAPAPGSTPGTLYVATLLAQPGVTSNGVGTATLRVSEDETVAYLRFNYSGLSGALGDWHIHPDSYNGKAGGNPVVLYDGAEPLPGDGPQPDGSHKWNIIASGPYTLQEVRDLLKQGKAYINLHTMDNPAGEIRGNFTLANGTRTFTPPPLPPALGASDHNTDAGASRFLAQATYGPSIADIQALKAMASYEAWIDDQFTKPAGLQLPEVYRTENASAQGGAFDDNLTVNAWWWRSIAGDDQLRQRIAFALSQIHVVSGQGPLDNNAPAISYFYDRLAGGDLASVNRGAFGNFRDILEDTTLTPGMGRYLDMLRNDKPDQTIGRIPNENYAREIKQLFSVGLYRVWPDGTLMLTSKDAPIDTYTQREIVGLAHVFTGWDYGYDGAMHTSFTSAGNWTRQMRETPARHFTGPKRILNNEVLPGIAAQGGQPLDPHATHTSNNYFDTAYQALPALELDASHDQLFNHPNTGPFICRQLIQRLVTSHPSRDYVYRVVQKFNDNGSGVRGDMKAVIKAILLDYEARSTDFLNTPAYGKQREPLLRVAAAARAFRMAPWSGTYSQTNAAAQRTITIDLTPPQVHGLSTTGTVFLDFTSGVSGPAPWIGAYSAAVVDADTITVQAQGWMVSTSATSYTIPATSAVCTINISGHWIDNGNQIYIDFTGATAPPDGVYTVTSSNATNTTSGTSFTINVPTDPAARTGIAGSVAIPRFTPGSFTTSASGDPDPNKSRRVTMDTNVTHELIVGDQVQLNFYFGSNPQPPDYVATVDTVVDLNTWTFLAPTIGTNFSPNQGNNQVYQFPLKSLPVNRTGAVGSRPSTFAMNNTDLALAQTPIGAPTVFNFFVPDYKYPGTLASQGITTPEFAITAETTAIRQANYLYDGLFNPGQNVLSSFSTGSNALVMNYASWLNNTSTNLGLGAPTDPALPWTHNQNLPTLVDQMSTLLMAGQLSTDVKTVVKNYVSRKISSIGTGPTPGVSPCVVTTVDNHGYASTDQVCISGVNGGTFSTTLNSNSTLRNIVVTGAKTFTVTGVTCTVAPTAGNLTNAHVSPLAYNNGTGTPSATEKRDRLRTILHLILTSPDFTIQK